MVLILLVSFLFFLTYMMTDSLNKSSCDDYGKTRFNGQVYECKKVEKK